MAEEGVRSTRVARKCAEVARIIVKQEIRARVKQISEILKKPENVRTEADKNVLEESPEIVQSAKKRASTRLLNEQRKLEVEDDEHVLEEKCAKLAEAIKKSKHLVIYTGAGISTAASIPDYRGPNGIWTLLGKGIQPKAQELSDAEPTFTHMAISSLYKAGKVQYMVSQNCDGLHVRSGFPKERLSELHGNMYLEWCKSCNPHRHFYRLFDVTEKTALRRHSTGRHCHQCKNELRDTIVHFGEKGPLCPPYRWHEAVNAANSADVILCLGSSLKVLRKYQCLWSPHIPAKDRAKLYIVNLQWTPKDEVAKCKINGKCDIVLKKVMKQLGISVQQYQRSSDPLYHLATPLQSDEGGTTSKRSLSIPEDLQPFQDNLLPKHKIKEKSRKRKVTSSPRGGEQNDKMKSRRNQSTVANNAKDKKNHTALQYDSDTLDAPETLEILKKEQEQNHQTRNGHTDQKDNVSRIECVVSKIKNETCTATGNEDDDNLLVSKSGDTQDTPNKVEVNAETILMSSKHKYIKTDQSMSKIKQESNNDYATVKSLLEMKHESSANDFATVKSLLALSAQPPMSMAVIRKPVLHCVSSANDTCCSKNQVATTSTNITPCQNVSAPSQMHVVSPFQLVPNNKSLNSFHSYCLTPVSTKDDVGSAYTSIKPTSTQSQSSQETEQCNSVSSASDNSQSVSSTSGCGGGIMQSLQVYKSLEDHDYCSLKKREDLVANTQETNITSQSITTPALHVPITKPSTQKTVAELLRERDDSRAQTTVVSSRHIQHNNSIKSECHSGSFSIGKAIAPRPIKVESVRLPNPNIKIQGNILLRQFIPNSQCSVVYPTARVVDMTRLRPIVPQGAIPQVVAVAPNSNFGVRKTLAPMCLGTPAISVQCADKVISKQGLLQQSSSIHKLHQSSTCKNSLAVPVTVCSSSISTVCSPSHLSPPLTHATPVTHSVFHAQSLIPQVIPSLTKPSTSKPECELLPKPNVTILDETPLPVESDCKAGNDDDDYVVTMAESTSDNKTVSWTHTSAITKTSEKLCDSEKYASRQKDEPDTSSNAETTEMCDSSPKSAPGWFGKGFNYRKGRRKRGKLT